MTELHDIAVRLLGFCRETPFPCVILLVFRIAHAASGGRAILVSDYEALVRRVVEAIWNRGDLDVADELFAANYVNHEGLIADLLGPEAIKISAALYRVAFPGLHVRVEEISTVEDTVLLRWTASNASDKLDATNLASEPKSLAGMTRGRIAAGKIVESWTEWERVGVLNE